MELRSEMKLKYQVGNLSRPVPMIGKEQNTFAGATLETLSAWLFFNPAWVHEYLFTVA